MTIKSFLACERKNLEKLKKYQLPHRFKIVGAVLALLSFVFLFINRFSFNDLDYRAMAKYGMLIGMLFISISKDKIEDEFIIKLRMQSYTFAFIMGVILTLFQPFINYFVDFIVASDTATLKDTGDFEILWILLSVQLFYFEFLKRIYK